ncbi:MAG: hypothetical protein J6A54_03750 [Clostridia bacterium]|nr:hypothetical protein [Clostridia bacterium]
MKKVILILVIVLSLLMLVSCANSQNSSKAQAKKLLRIDDERERANALIAYVDENLLNLNSFQINSELKMTTLKSGVKHDSVVKGVEIFGGMNTDELYYYNEINAVIKLQSFDGEIGKKTSIEAYDDGEMYVQYADEISKEKVLMSSPTEQEEFLDYFESKLETDVDITDCTSVTCVQNEDKSWTTTFRGFSKKTISIFATEAGIEEDELGAEIIDLKCSFNVDENMMISSCNMELEFEGFAEAPSCNMSIDYSNFNDIKEKKIDKDKYRKVDSIIAIKRVADELDKLENLQNASFTVNTKKKSKYGDNEQRVTERETYDVSYGVEQGKYFYNITAELDRVPYDISYSNGCQITESRGIIHKKEKGEAIAKAQIRQLLNTANFDENRITKVNRKFDNVYEFIIESPDISEIQPLLNQMNATNLDLKIQTITVTFGKNGISKIEEETRAHAYLGEALCVASSESVVEIK